MKIIGMELEWMEKYANFPGFVLLCEGEPYTTEDYIYQKKSLSEDRDIYFASREDGQVSFFSHSKKDMRGFGGAVFNLALTDGTTAKVEGPWSSNHMFMNGHFTFSNSVTYKLTDGSLRSGNMALPELMHHFRQFRPKDVHMLKVWWNKKKENNSFSVMPSLSTCEVLKPGNNVCHWDNPIDLLIY